MSHRPFRFLHAADLRLGIPPQGMAEIPPPLREVLLESVPQAAQRLVDVAEAESVDFVVLAGGVLDIRLASARDLALVCDMFERLAEAQIAVYWVGGAIDPPDRWPDAIRLPDLVHQFATGQVTRTAHSRDGRPLVELAGANSKRRRRIKPADYLADVTTLPTVVVAHGSIDARKLEKQLSRQDLPSYWALGSQHARDTLLSGKHIAHYCGTPQGRGPDECGPRGATLVEFDQDGVFHTSFVETDIIRWYNEPFDVDAQTTRDQLEEMFRVRIDELRESNPDKTIVVDWSIGGEGTLLDELRVGSLQAELVELLRNEYGHREVPVWTSNIHRAASREAADEHVTQNTILGDFLRTLDTFADGQQSLDLGSLLPDRSLMKSLDAEFDLSQPDDFDRILNEARTRGIDLLGGDPTQPATVDREAATVDREAATVDREAGGSGL